MATQKKTTNAKKPGAGTKGFARAENLWAKSFDYWILRSGKSEQEVADAIGVSQGMVSHWRVGRYVPPALSNEAVVVRIAEVLGLDKVAADRFLNDARMSALPEWAVTIISGQKKRIAELEARSK